MPTYEVDTDQGTFEVSLDREPESPEQLQKLVAQHIGAVPVRDNNKPERRSGFLQTTGQEFAGGTSDVAEGIKRALGIGREPNIKNVFTDPALGMAQAGIGGLRMLFAPLEGARQKVGEVGQDITASLGASPDVSAGVGTAANLATLMLGPGALVKGGSRVAGRAVRPFGELSARSKTLVESSKEFEVPLSTAQTRLSASMAQVEALPQRFPLGVRPVAKFGQKQIEATKEAVGKVGGKISPEKLTPTEAGELLAKELIPKAKDAARQSSNAAYDTVKTAVPEGQLFETPKLLKKTQEILRGTELAKGLLPKKGEKIAKAISSKLSPEAGLPKELEQFKGIKSEQLQQIIDEFSLANKDRQITFEGMDVLRKRLRDQLRTIEKSGRDNEARQVRELISSLTEDMRSAAEGFPEAITLLDKADQQYLREVVPFFTRGKLPRKLTEQDASQVAKTFIWGNRDRPEQIELVKKAINKPQEFNKVVRSWWEDLAEKSVDPQTNIFSPGRFVTNFKRFSPEVQTSLLESNAPEARRLIDLFEAINTSAIQGANPSQTARGILGWAQGSIVLDIGRNILSGNLPAAISEGAVVLTPLALGKVLTNPTGIKFLTVGLTNPLGNPEATLAGARLLAIANAMPENEINDFLKSDLVSIQEKISAALGNRTPQ